MNEDLNTDISNLEPANVTILQLLRAGFKLEEEPFFRGVLETMKKNGYHQLKMKSNIMIEQSARIIGVTLNRYRSSINTIFWKQVNFIAQLRIASTLTPKESMSRDRSLSPETPVSTLPILEK